MVRIEPKVSLIVESCTKSLEDLFPKIFPLCLDLNRYTSTSIILCATLPSSSPPVRHIVLMSMEGVAHRMVYTVNQRQEKVGHVPHRIHIKIHAVNIYTCLTLLITKNTVVAYFNFVLFTR